MVPKHTWKEHLPWLDSKRIEAFLAYYAFVSILSTNPYASFMFTSLISWAVEASFLAPLGHKFIRPRAW